MNAAHIHLLLNHFPTVGFSVGLALLVIAFFGKSAELTRASLVILFMIAALTIAIFVSGNDAQAAMKDDSNLSVAFIDAHESAALVAFAFMQVTGFFAWLGLWMLRRGSRLTKGYLALVLILSVTTFGLMARAANLGGEIRHPEIRAVPDDSSSDAAATLTASWRAYVEKHAWVWPTCETLHFVGLSMLLGIVLTLDLRMLGIGKSLSFAALYQFLPFGMLGFCINLVTGIAFFVAKPEQYAGLLFGLKMTLVVLGAGNVLYFMLLDEPWTVGAGDDAPIRTKCMAASAIVIWLGVLFCGHMLPWLGNSF